MKNQPSPSCAPKFVFVIVLIIVFLCTRIDWTRPENSADVLLVLISGSTVMALAVAMAYQNWHWSHDPAKEVHADIMNAIYESKIPSHVWRRAVGKYAYRVNEERYYWRDGWNINRVYLTWEQEKEREYARISGN